MNKGELFLGSNFEANYGLFISCGKRISIGDNCAIGWNCSFFDGDGHKIYTDGKENLSKEIEIEDHCWLCSECTFLKGAHVASETVVSYGTTVATKFMEGNCILGGNPARILKKIDAWEK